MKRKASYQLQKPKLQRQGAVYGRAALQRAPKPTRPLALEKKFLDTSVLNNVDVTAGVIINLALVPQGQTDVTRIGNKITATSIACRGLTTQDTATNGTLRIIVFIDKQANGAAAAVTDILETANFASFRNLDNVDRFDILVDDYHTINAMNTGSGSEYFWQYYKKLDVPIHFSGATGAITELRSNNIGILYISSIAALNAAQLGGVARLRYTDL